MSANRLDQWADQVDGQVFTEPVERPSYVVPESWPTKGRPPNADRQSALERQHQAFLRTLVEAIVTFVCIVLIFLGVWTWDQVMNHGLGDGGKGRGDNAAWVGEPASVVQPVAQGSGR